MYTIPNTTHYCTVFIVSRIVESLSLYNIHLLGGATQKLHIASYLVRAPLIFLTIEMELFTSLPVVIVSEAILFCTDLKIIAMELHIASWNVT